MNQTFLGLPTSGLENLKHFSKEGLLAMIAAANDDYQLNRVRVASAKGCSGHENECGVCLNSVWYPCA